MATKELIAIEELEEEELEKIRMKNSTSSCYYLES